MATIKISKVKILIKPRRLIITKSRLNRPRNNNRKVRRIKICVYYIKNHWKSSALSIFKKFVLNVPFSANIRAMILKVFSKFNRKMILSIINFSAFMTKKQ
jgi:hypothetical protein